MPVSSFPSPEDFDDEGSAFEEGTEGLTPSEDSGSEGIDSTEVSTETPEQVEASGQTESTETPVSNKLSVDEYGNHMVDITVDGEVLTVPLSEALSGYSRTEDYTRKRQRDAELVKAGEAFQALQQKLQDTPKEVLTALAQRFNVNLDGTPATSTEAASAPTMDQLPPEMQAMAQWVAQQQQEADDRLLDQTLAGFEAQDPEFDRDQFIQSAVNAGLTEIAQLGDFYKIQAYDRVMGKQQANTQHSAAQAADDAQRQAAAQAAAETLTSGAGATPGSSAPTSFDNFEDAFEHAVAASGGWSD